MTFQIVHNAKHVCKYCGKPLDVIEHPKMRGNGSYTYVTCWNQDCEAWGDTVDWDDYGSYRAELYQHCRGKKRGQSK